MHSFDQDTSYVYCGLHLISVQWIIRSKNADFRTTEGSVLRWNSFVVAEVETNKWRLVSILVIYFLLKEKGLHSWFCFE